MEELMWLNYAISVTIIKSNHNSTMIVILTYTLIIGSSKIIRLREENSETSEILKGKSSGNGASVPVKGINNLGNTCFFNAVMQVRWKDHTAFS